MRRRSKPQMAYGHTMKPATGLRHISGRTTVSSTVEKTRRWQWPCRNGRSAALTVRIAADLGSLNLGGRIFRSFATQGRKFIASRRIIL